MKKIHASLFLVLVLAVNAPSALAESASSGTKRTKVTTSTSKSVSNSKQNSSPKTPGKAARKAGPVKSETEAVAIVNADPEVKKFLALIKKSGMKGSSAFVEFDRLEDGDYIVHVYQYVPDDAETGHTATMNWFHINAKTGKLSKEF